MDDIEADTARGNNNDDLYSLDFPELLEKPQHEGEHHYAIISPSSLSQVSIGDTNVLAEETYSNFAYLDGNLRALERQPSPAPRFSQEYRRIDAYHEEREIILARQQFQRDIELLKRDLERRQYLLDRAIHIQTDCIPYELYLLPQPWSLASRECALRRPALLEQYYTVEGRIADNLKARLETLHLMQSELGDSYIFGKLAQELAMLNEQVRIRQRDKDQGNDEQVLGAVLDGVESILYESVKMKFGRLVAIAEEDDTQAITKLWPGMERMIETIPSLRERLQEYRMIEEDCFPTRMRDIARTEDIEDEPDHVDKGT